MWPYKEHSYEKFKESISKVKKYIEQSGAVYCGTTKETCATIVGGKTYTEDIIYDVWKYNAEYFYVDSMFFPNKPFIVLVFGNSMENILEDADPFPYDLPDEELLNEVQYCLGIKPYPKELPEGSGL